MTTMHRIIIYDIGICTFNGHLPFGNWQLRYKTRCWRVSITLNAYTINYVRYNTPANGVRLIIVVSIPVGFQIGPFFGYFLLFSITYVILFNPLMYKYRVLFTILIKHSAFVREPISMPFEDLFHESDSDEFYHITSMWL